MSTFKNIQGKNIRSYANNAPNATAGEMWYNRTEQKLKGVVAIGAWSSSSPQTTQREGGTATMGTLTAGLIAGGSDPSAPYTNATEEYDGSGWATGGNLGTGRTAYAGGGSQTAGLVAGGYNGSNVALSEEYNGSSWSEGNNINTARRAYGACGTQTAGLLVGGYISGPTNVAEEYDGSSWTTVTSAPTNNYSGGMVGIQTSAIQIAGATNPGQNCFEYDGTNWTTGGTLTTGRSGGGYSGANNDAAMAISGETPPGTKTTNCEQYDGTSWTEVNNVTTARVPSGNSPSGTKTDAYFSGGQSGLKFTEEFNTSSNTITAAAWASGGALGTARYQIGGAGDLPAGLAYGGYSAPGPIGTRTEEYNGTSWAEQNDLSTPHGQISGQHIGTQTSALAAGGTTGGSPNYGPETEEYNGTSWTNGGNLTEDGGRSYIAGFGTQTAAVAGGGYAQTGATANSEHYDGSSWTAANNMNTGRYGASGTGTQTAGLAVGQYPGTGTVEEYNGTNWTSVTSYPAGRFGIYGGMGTQTDCIYAGGSASTTRTTETFGYDGTTWSTRPALGTALSSGASGGTSSSAFIAGGRGSPPGPTAGVTTTEEFTGETSALNIVDITTS